MSSRRLLTPMLLASLLAACGDDGTPPPACKETGTFVRIETPADQSLLTDDVNANLPGFQTTLTASTDLPSGKTLQVLVNGTPVSETVRVASGRIETEVTLINGSNSVAVSAMVCDRPVKAATLVSVAPDGCEFVLPPEGSTIDEGLDKDTTRDGVQTDVVARCKAFEAGAAATLRINSAEVMQGTFDDKGAVTFPAISFFSGRATVSMWVDDEKKLQGTYDVVIEGECPLTLEPVADTMFNVGGDPSEVWPNARGDADPATAGIQADITVTTECQNPTRAHLRDRNGIELGAADFDSGKAVVRILAQEGDFGVYPTVEADARVQAGNPVGYHSDSVVPTCVITAPANGGAAEDTDPVTPDVQFTIGGHCENLDPGSLVELRISQATAEPGTTAKIGTLAEDGSFSFDWQVVAGEYKAWVGGVRPSGNRSATTVNVVRFVAGVPSCAITEPAENFATSSTALNVKVRSNVNPGTDVVITVTDPDGQPQSQTVQAVPAAAGGTQATAAFTLSATEGVHQVTAQCGGAGMAAPVPVEFDQTSPVLQVKLPGSGVINQAIADAKPATPEFDLLVSVDADSIQDGSTGTIRFRCIPSNVTSTVDTPITFTGNKASAPVPMEGVPENENCTFTANATDLAGNEANPATAAAIFDRSGPQITGSFPPGAFQLVAPGNPRIDGTTVIANQAAGNTPTLTFTFTTAGGVGGQLILEDPATGTVYGSQSIAPDGNVELPGVVLPQGRTLNLDVRLTDSASNVTIMQLPGTIDVIAPAVPTAPLLTIDDFQTASGTFTFVEPSGDEGGEGAVSSYEVRWTPLTTLAPVTVFTDDNLAASVTPPAPVGSGGEVNATVSFPPMGDKMVCARALDSVGNVGPGACASASSAWTEVKFTSDQNRRSLGGQVLAISSVDGDELDDVVVAEFTRADGGGIASGAVHLFSGSAVLEDAMAAPLATLFGTDAGERCGEKLATGDFDGDGTADLVVACHLWSASRGRVMIYFGGVGDVNDDGENDGFSETVRAIVTGPASTTARFGAAVASLGDLDGDGADELFASNSHVGATGPGEAYVLFGRSRAAWATATLTDEDAVAITGENDGDMFGYRWGAANVGDIDGDGTPDVVIPASAVNKVHIFSGADIVDPPAEGLDAALATSIEEDVANAPGSATGLFEGFGHQTAGTDLTGDGVGDLLVVDASQKSGGKIRIYPGDADAGAFDATASQTLAWPGGAAYRLGYAMALGDLTGDGSPEVVLGNNAALTATFVIYRGTGIAGDQPFEKIPAKVGGAGNTVLGVATAIVDLDGDGNNELVVGEPLGGNGTVRVYTVP